MADDDDEFIDAIESDPSFICSQLRSGHMLTDGDVAAIQSLLSEMDKRENEQIDEFHRGREFGIREVGGDELWAAVEANNKAWMTKITRAAMARIFAKTEEVKAETLPPSASESDGEVDA